MNRLANRLLAALGAILALGVLGCAWSTMPATGSKLNALPSDSHYRVGVREIDITPPPGLSLFGHGPESRVATGTLLRLRCQVFVISGGLAGETDAVAIVPCELSQPSLVLQRAVAERVARCTPLGADRIVLTATHTHAAPGHIFGSENLSGPFSSRMYGFDEDVVAFLATRIADGIAEAWKNRVPARIRFGVDDEPHWLGRNRSMGPFLRNDPRPPWFDQLVAQHPDRPRADLAVDSRLAMVRFDRVEPDERGCGSLGALAIFGLHPTGIGNENSLYHGDIFGFATRAASQALSRDTGCDDVVVGLANGIEGDVTPNVGSQAPIGARRLGERLGTHMADLWKMLATRAEDASGPLRVAYQELDMSAAPARPDGRAATCRDPALGAAASGGASDNPTGLRSFHQLREGVRLQEPNGCHGPKVRVLQALGSACAGQHFPRWAPIMQIQIGDGLIVTIPAEPTTVTGLRIRDSVMAEVHAISPPTRPPTQVALVSLAHEYLQYVATREEYELQHYEGASTIYGPSTAELLANRHRCLTRSLYGAPPDDYCRDEGASGQSKHHRKVGEVWEVGYNPGYRINRLEPETPARTELKLVDGPRKVVTQDGRQGLDLRWDGPPLDEGRVYEREPMRVRIQCESTGVVVDDDAGSSIEVRFVAPTEDGGLWCALWTPEESPDCAGAVRVLLRYGDQVDGEVRSQPFAWDGSQEVEARACQ